VQGGHRLFGYLEVAGWITTPPFRRVTRCVPEAAWFYVGAFHERVVWTSLGQSMIRNRIIADLEGVWAGLEHSKRLGDASRLATLLAGASRAHRACDREAARATELWVPNASNTVLCTSTLARVLGLPQHILSVYLHAAGWLTGSSCTRVNRTVPAEAYVYLGRGALSVAWTQKGVNMIRELLTTRFSAVCRVPVPRPLEAQDEEQWDGLFPAPDLDLGWEW
jgi:hypothetical protein